MLQKVTTQNLLLPVCAVDDFLDQCFCLINLPTLTHIRNLVYKLRTVATFLLALQSDYPQLKDSELCLINDCPKYHRVIPGFI